MFDTSLSDLDYVAKILAPEELIQVCVGENQVILNFSGSLSILIQSKIEITSGSNVETILSDRPNDTKQLVSFLGKSIQSHCVEEDGAISLVFSDNRILKMLRNDYYESFSMSKGSDAIYV